MKHSWSIWILCIVTNLPSALGQTPSSGHETGNGGDMNTPELRSTLDSMSRYSLMPAYENLSPPNDAYGHVQRELFSRRFEILSLLDPNSTQRPIIEATTQPIMIGEPGRLREVDARNYRDDRGRGYIQINLVRWNLLDRCSQEKLYHHEILGLLGIERTNELSYTRAMSDLLRGCGPREVAISEPHIRGFPIGAIEGYDAPVKAQIFCAIRGFPIVGEYTLRALRSHERYVNLERLPAHPSSSRPRYLGTTAQYDPTNHLRNFRVLSSVTCRAW